MRYAVLICFILILAGIPALAQENLTEEEKSWIDKADTYEQDGWIYLYVEGEPFERGFQNGFLLSGKNDREKMGFLPASGGRYVPARNGYGV